MEHNERMGGGSHAVRERESISACVPFLAGQKGDRSNGKEPLHRTKAILPFTAPTHIKTNPHHEPSAPPWHTACTEEPSTTKILRGDPGALKKSRRTPPRPVKL
jgi:hypothetical protein